jgi:HNH endonuclease
VEPSKRFWGKVETTPNCWNWLGSFTHNGYGRFALTPMKTVRAHRFAFEDFYGEIPQGLQVCHHCDNPKCVRPDHLFLGTMKENVDDRERKGRGDGKNRKGEKHPYSKLTAQDVYQIRYLYAATTMSQDRLAEEFHISQAQIWRVIHGKNW